MMSINSPFKQSKKIKQRSLSNKNRGRVYLWRLDRTNVYGKKRCVQRGDDFTKWREVDESEMLAFLRILFIMGFHNLPRIRDYWSQDRNLVAPVVAHTMARDEFYRLFSNIHLADNSKWLEKTLVIITNYIHSMFL